MIAAMVAAPGTGACRVGKTLPHKAAIQHSQRRRSTAPTRALTFGDVVKISNVDMIPPCGCGRVKPYGQLPQTKSPPRVPFRGGDLGAAKEGRSSGLLRGLEPFGSGQLAQPAQRLDLQLPDALAGQ